MRRFFLEKRRPQSAAWQKFVAGSLALLILIGCAPRPGARPEPQRPSDKGLATAAHEAVRSYASELARVARETADKADSFTSHTAAVEFGAEQNRLAREQAFAPLFERVNAELLGAHAPPGEQKPYDAAATARVFRELAEGFSRAAAAAKNSSHRSER